MAESLSIGESVSVEVVRASPFSSANVPPESFFVVLGIIVAAAFIILALKKSRKAGVEPSGKNRKRRLLRSILVSAAFGFFTFMVSGDTLSWLLAVLIFYYEYSIKRESS
jgi:hypothetical protein